METECFSKKKLLPAGLAQSQPLGGIQSNHRAGHLSTAKGDKVGRQCSIPSLPWGVSVGPSSLTVLLIGIIGVISHQLCTARSFMVFFGHKYDPILP